MYCKVNCKLSVPPASPLVSANGSARLRSFQVTFHDLPSVVEGLRFCFFVFFRVASDFFNVCRQDLVTEVSGYFPIGEKKRNFCN